MIPDLHMHTHFSHDAAPVSTVAALCERAIELGIPCIAVTDHFDVDHECAPIPDRTLDRNGIYNEILEAREQYGDKIRILHGIEAGQIIVHPKEALAMLAEHDYDLILGSLHGFPNVPGFSHYDFSKYSDEECKEMFGRMIEYTFELCELPINVVAHLTYMHRYLRRAGRNLKFSDFFEKLEELFRVMIARDIALEVNTSTFSEGITLPTAEIVSFYRECGGRLLTVGSDAHHPKNMAKGFAETAEMIKSCGFDSIAVPTTKGILEFPVKA